MERDFIQKINQDCHLGLNEPDLKQLISRIQELIGKPPVYWENSSKVEELEKELNQSQATIAKLEKKLTDRRLNASFGEDLETIKSLELQSLEELFGQTINDTIRQQIQQAANYQQVVQVRQNFIQSQLGEKSAQTQTDDKLKQQPVVTPQEKIILLSLSIVSLLVIGRSLRRPLAKKRQNKIT